MWDVGLGLRDGVAGAMRADVMRVGPYDVVQNSRIHNARRGRLGETVREQTAQRTSTGFEVIKTRNTPKGVLGRD